MKTNCDVYVLFEPVYILSKCFFLAPDTLKKDFTKKPVNFYIIIIGILFSVFLVLTYLALEDIGRAEQFIPNKITLNFDRVIAILQATAVLIIFWTSYKQRNKLTDILASLDDVDRSMLELFKKKPPFNKIILKNERVYLGHFFLSFLFQCGSIAFAWWAQGSVQWNTISHIITMCLKSTMVFQHIAVLNYTYWRFKLLNNLLKSVDYQIESDSSISTKHADPNLTPVLTISEAYENVKDSKFSPDKHSYKEKMMQEKVKDYIKLSRIVHDGLCDICRTLDDMFGYFHAVAIISTAVEQLREVFAIFLIVKIGRTDDLAYAHAARGVLQMTFNVTTHFFFLFYFCNIVQKESKETGDVIQRFHLGNKNKKFLESEVRAFSLQVKHSFLTFSAVDLFELDWGLLIDVSNDVTSYFIFFLQYQVTEDARVLEQQNAMRSS